MTRRRSSTRSPALRKLNDEVETPLIDVLVEMESNGIAIDPNVLKEQSDVLGERIEELREQIMEEAGTEFNPDSPKQLGDVLFNKLKLKVVKKTKTGPSTDVEVLEKLADRAPGAEADPGISQPGEAEEHVSRQPHRLREPARPAGSTPASTRPAPRPGG